MRGPYDSKLEGVRSLSLERSVVQKIPIKRALLKRYVTRRWGPVVQCYVPHNEALDVYNSGLKAPGDVTIIWPDDNFGYICHLSNPHQRQRPAGTGLYYHIEYLNIYSYTWQGSKLANGKSAALPVKARLLFHIDTRLSFSSLPKASKCANNTQHNRIGW